MLSSVMPGGFRGRRKQAEYKRSTELLATFGQTAQTLNDPERLVPFAQGTAP